MSKPASPNLNTAPGGANASFASATSGQQRQAPGTPAALAAPPIPVVLAPNEHFFNPQAPEKMPWEMTLEERRRASKDPRIRKQVADEDQWNGTVVQGVWRKIRQFAMPTKNWVMSPDDFRAMLNANGIEGRHMQEKLLVTFDPRKEGRYNGLVVCKIMEIALNPAGKFCEDFVRHCFNQFDRANPHDEFLEREVLQRVKLQNPAELAAGGKKGSGSGGKRSGGSLPLTMLSGATFDMVEGLKQCWDAGTIVTVRDTVITYGEFRHGFLDPINAAWVASFFTCFLEVAASKFAPPNGTLPLVPLRWLVTTEPVDSSEEMADADVLLLREIEELGVDPLSPKKDKKKGGGGAAASKKQ